MLVLRRQLNEVILIGDERTAMAQISPLDEEMLRACPDESLRDLFDRLLATLGHPIAIATVEVRGDSVRLGIDAPRAIDVDRKEVREASRRAIVDQSTMPNHVMPTIAALN